MDSGFWAGSVPPWASVVMVLVAMAVFILGVVAGMDWARRLIAREAREREAEAAADRFIGELHHDPDPDREAMARRTHPVYRRRAEIVDEPRTQPISRQLAERRSCRTSTAAFLDPQAHEDQAVALTQPETDEEWTARMHASMDRFIAEHIHGSES